MPDLQQCEKISRRAYKARLTRIIVERIDAIFGVPQTVQTRIQSSRRLPARLRPLAIVCFDTFHRGLQWLERPFDEENVAKGGQEACHAQPQSGWGYTPYSNLLARTDDNAGLQTLKEASGIKKQSGSVSTWCIRCQRFRALTNYSLRRSKASSFNTVSFPCPVGLPSTRPNYLLAVPSGVQIYPLNSRSRSMHIRLRLSIVRD